LNLHLHPPQWGIDGEMAHAAGSPADS